MLLKLGHSKKLRKLAIIFWQYKKIKMENKGKILVIDDSATNVFLLQTLLEDYGYEVVFAYSGKEAIKHIDEQNFDLLLLDIMMPEIDGYDILDKLTREQKIKSTPVVMVTAKEDAESQQKALDMGAVDYITKPVNLDKFLKVVKKYLN